MNSSQFFPYYPKYEYLDGVLTSVGKNRLNIFVDIKGCMGSLYQEWAVKEIVDNTTISGVIDTSIFKSFLEFVGWHKQYAKKRNIDLHLYFFAENGKSVYHQEVYKDYKKSRSTTDILLKMLDNNPIKKEVCSKIISKNHEIMNKVGNKIPNCSVIHLDYLEADFIPYYLITRHLVNAENSCNIIYSLDKDMLQCLRPNVYQYYRHFKNRKMISHKDVYNHYLKTEEPIDIDPSWFSLILSIDGDTSDGFSGVYGVSKKSIIKILEQLIIISQKDVQRLYDRIELGESIFDKGYSPNNPSLKKIVLEEATIVRNLKLSSFELLSRKVDSGFPIDMIKKKKTITDTVFNSNKIVNYKVMQAALGQCGLGKNYEDEVFMNLFV